LDRIEKTVKEVNNFDKLRAMTGGILDHYAGKDWNFGVYAVNSEWKDKNLVLFPILFPEYYLASLLRKINQGANLR
jgi:hypothetical protein